MAITRADIYHNLALMLNAGLPVTRALRTAGGDSRAKLPAALRQAADHIGQGMTVTEALARHPRLFHPFDLTMLRAGEESGLLGDVLQALAQWHRLRLRMRRMVISNLIYPAALLHVAVLIPPLPALILGNITGLQYLLAVGATLVCIYAPIAAVTTIYRLTPHAGPLRSLLDGLLLRLPLLGGAIRNLALARYCRSFHMLLQAGVPITHCAATSADLAGNATMARILAAGAHSARAGQPVSEGFAAHLPQDFVQIWQTGEQSGSLDVVLAKLADLTADRAEFTFTELARWTPRLIYLLIVLYAASVILRMYGAILP